MVRHGDLTSMKAPTYRDVLGQPMRLSNKSYEV